MTTAVRPISQTRLLACLAAFVFAACRSHSDVSNEYRLARELLQAERYDAALSLADRWLRHSQQNLNPDFEWRFRLLKAEVLLARHQVEQASALIAGHPNGSTQVELTGRALLLQGQIAYLESRYRDAEDLLARAAEFAKQAGSRTLAGEVLLRRGTVWMRLEQFDRAEDAFRRVIEAASQTHDYHLEGSGTGNLGVNLMTTGRYAESIPWLERARSAFRRIGAEDSLARTDGNLGASYFWLGDFDKARLLFERAQLAFAKSGNRFEEQVWLGHLGNVWLEKREFPAAVSAFQRALAMARDVPTDHWAAEWLHNLALTYVELRDWNSAERYNRESLEMKRNSPEHPALNGSLYLAGRIAAGQKRYSAAETAYREALSGTAGESGDVLNAHTGLAVVYLETARPQAAETEFSAARTMVERAAFNPGRGETKFSYATDIQHFFRAYVDFLMANNKPEEAFAVAEASRSRILGGRLGDWGAPRLNAVKAYTGLARQSDGVLLEYWLGSPQSYAWVVTSTRIRSCKLPPEDEIRVLVEAYRQAVMSQRNPLEQAAESGRRLYQALLAPLGESLNQKRRFVIVPDGELFSLDFGTLPARLNAHQFLIEEATLSTALSLSSLLGSPRATQAHRKPAFLLIGNPAGSPHQDWPRSFGAREMDSIASAVGRSLTKIVRGSTASPDSYAKARPAQFDFVHFSTTAIVDQQSPLDSAVILSGPPEQCKLFARDVMAVPLTAELVTISACQNAGAKTYAGEGLAGFSWAFLRAGARNVIAGLWDVNDRSTAQLMSALYAAIARGSTPADALRAAKLSLIHGGGSYAKPFYWAPFQLYTGAIN